MSDEFQSGLGTDGALNALQQLWGDRSPLRKMLATPQEVRAYMFAKRMAELGFDGMEEYAKLLADATQAIEGRETDLLIQALKAVKAQVHLPEPIRYRGNE